MHPEVSQCLHTIGSIVSCYSHPKTLQPPQKKNKQRKKTFIFLQLSGSSVRPEQDVGPLDLQACSLEVRVERRQAEAVYGRPCITAVQREERRSLTAEKTFPAICGKHEQLCARSGGRQCRRSVQLSKPESNVEEGIIFAQARLCLSAYFPVWLLNIYAENTS